MRIVYRDMGGVFAQRLLGDERYRGLVVSWALLLLCMVQCNERCYETGTRREQYRKKNTDLSSKDMCQASSALCIYSETVDHLLILNIITMEHCRDETSVILLT